MESIRWEKIEKMIKSENKKKVKCVCGRKVYIYPNENYSICSWCGRKVTDKEIIENDRKRKIFSNKLREMI